MTRIELERTDPHIELFRKAGRGEKPLCPKCGEGHIISLCNGRIYKCDNKNCNNYYSLLLDR